MPVCGNEKFTNVITFNEIFTSKSKPQMKMFLTRIGFGSKTVVTGDITQIDLPNCRESGLRSVSDILLNIEGVGFNYFSSKDVVRHKIVGRILDAYEEYEKKRNIT